MEAAHTGLSRFSKLELRFVQCFRQSWYSISNWEKSLLNQYRKRMFFGSFISRTCQREETNEARYAIKILHAELANDPALFEKGCIDLAMEAQFLSNFVHPNIIKVRGAGCEALVGTKDYFLVMDRLYNTLEGKMEEWKATSKKMGMFAKKDAKKAFLKDRLTVAFELSSALNYMHARK